MRTTIVSGTRHELLAHLLNAVAALEAGDSYRCSTVSANGGGTDLVFEVDPALDEYRATHLIVFEADGRMGRPETWVAGESLR